MVVLASPSAKWQPIPEEVESLPSPEEQPRGFVLTDWQRALQDDAASGSAMQAAIEADAVQWRQAEEPPVDDAASSSSVESYSFPPSRGAQEFFIGSSNASSIDASSLVESYNMLTTSLAMVLACTPLRADQSPPPVAVPASSSGSVASDYRMSSWTKVPSQTAASWGKTIVEEPAVTHSNLMLCEHDD